jgi:hypothetical protein
LKRIVFDFPVAIDLSRHGSDRSGGQLLWLSVEDVHGAFEVVGNGGEVDLDGCFGEAAPSHSAQAVAALPCSENFLDPSPYPMDRFVLFVDFA